MPRSLQPVQQLRRPQHRLDPVLELGDDQLVQLLDQLGGAAGLAQAPLEDATGDLGRGADQLALVLGREVEATALEEVLLGAGPDRLGVEQEAVVVEDDGGGQERLHRREHMVVACPSTSRSAAASTTPAPSTSAASS